MILKIPYSATYYSFYDDEKSEWSSLQFRENKTPAFLSQRYCRAQVNTSSWNMVIPDSDGHIPTNYWTWGKSGNFPDFTSDKGGRFRFLTTKYAAEIIEPPSTPLSDITEFYFERATPIDRKFNMLKYGPFLVSFEAGQFGPYRAKVYYWNHRNYKFEVIRSVHQNSNNFNIYMSDDILVYGIEPLVYKTEKGNWVAGFSTNFQFFQHCVVYDSIKDDFYNTKVICTNSFMNFKIPAFVYLNDGTLDAILHLFSSWDKNNKSYEKIGTNTHSPAIYIGA